MMDKYIPNWEKSGTVKYMVVQFIVFHVVQCQPC